MSGPTGEQRVILGPLTSTWTAPSACSVLVQDCVTCGVAWAAQTCFASTATSSVNFGPEDNTDCWPPRSSFASTPAPPFAGWGFYSPGLDCPYGMTPACSATGGGSSGWAVQFGLLENETAVGCCPPHTTYSIHRWVLSDGSIEAMLAATARTSRRPAYRPRLRQAFRSEPANLPVLVVLLPPKQSPLQFQRLPYQHTHSMRP